jgi:hypothetical protein
MLGIGSRTELASLVAEERLEPDRTTSEKARA